MKKQKVETEYICGYTLQIDNLSLVSPNTQSNKNGQLVAHLIYIIILVDLLVWLVWFVWLSGNMEINVPVANV